MKQPIKLGFLSLNISLSIRAKVAKLKIGLLQLLVFSLYFIAIKSLRGCHP